MSFRKLLSVLIDLSVRSFKLTPDEMQVSQVVRADQELQTTKLAVAEMSIRDRYGLQILVGCERGHVRQVNAGNAQFKLFQFCHACNRLKSFDRKLPVANHESLEEPGLFIVLINILRKRISRDELRRNLSKQTVVATFARTWL